MSWIGALFRYASFSNSCHLCIAAAAIAPPPEVRGASRAEAIRFTEALEEEMPVRVMWLLARQVNGVYGPKRIFELGPERKSWPVS